MDSYQKAQQAFIHKNYQETITILSAAIKTDPQHLPSYILRGQTHAEMDNYKEAIIDFTKVVGMDSHYYEAYRNRGDVNAKIGKYHDALVDYSIAVELQKKCPMSYAGRAAVNTKLKLYEQALQDYSTAIKIDPKLVEAYAGRAHVYNLQGQYQLSIEDYTQAISLSPKQGDLYCRRGQIQHKTGAYSNAVQDYSKSIQLSGDKDDFYYRRALTHYKLENYKTALEDCQKCLELTAKHSNTLNLRGMVNEALGNYNQAVGDYNKAIRYAPLQASFYNNRGLYHLRMKNYKCYKASESDFQEALKLTPNNPGYLFNLAACKLEMSENDKAYEYLEYGVECVMEENQDVLCNMLGMSRKSINQLRKQMKEYCELLIKTDEAGEAGQLREDNESIMTIDELREELKELMIKRLTNLEEDTTSHKMEEHREQMEDLQGRIESVELMVSKDLRSSSKITTFKQQVRRQLRKIGKNIHYYTIIDSKLKNVQEKQLRDYYCCLTNFLFNHLTAYRLINQLLLQDNTTATLSAENIVFYSVSQSQPIYSLMPSFGVLVQTPFQIVESLLYKITHVLVKDVAQKVGKSHLNRNKAMGDAIVRVIGTLVKNGRFNEHLKQNFRDKNMNYLNQLWERIADGPELVSNKLMKSILGKFQYEEQVVVAHMALITKALQELDEEAFIRISQVEEGFVQLIEGCVWLKSRPQSMNPSAIKVRDKADSQIKEISSLTTVEEAEEKTECQIM